MAQNSASCLGFALMLATINCISVYLILLLPLYQSRFAHIANKFKMGAEQSSPVGIGYHSTAKQIIENFGEGKYLTGKTAIVTGGNSGIGYGFTIVIVLLLLQSFLRIPKWPTSTQVGDLQGAGICWSTSYSVLPLGFCWRVCY